MYLYYIMFMHFEFLTIGCSFAHIVGDSDILLREIFVCGNFSQTRRQPVSVIQQL